MREIKFRGMTISGDWVYGFVRKNENHQHKYKGWFIADSIHQPLAFDVRPETVGQFTGLRDKNGKEIYEGDILSHDDGMVYAEVVYDNSGSPCAYCDDKNVSFYELYETGVFNNVEVIGNIHENPELLEVKK